MKINIGLSGQQRAGVVAILNATLADEYVLYTRTRNYHWNVTGPHFNDLHKFFESQYGSIDEKIDEIAEFVRYFGEKVAASLSTFQKAARLKDDSGETLTAQKMVARLLADHEELIRNLRNDLQTAADKFGAADVADFLTRLLEDHQKMAWMLRSILQ